MAKHQRADLRAFKALVALVDERSVSRAAQRLGITQPRMSDMLARLRDMFQDPLLVRSTHGMVATDRALEISATVQAGLAHFDAAFGLEPFVPKTADRLFTVAMSEYLSLLLVPPLMRQLGQEAPDLQIAVKVTDPGRIREWLADRECDMAFGFFTNLGDSLRASILFEDEPICVVSAGNAGVGASLSLEQYCRHRHAAMGGAPFPVSTMEQMVDAALAHVAQSRRVAVRVPSLPALAEIVAQTDLLATLPRQLAGQLAARASVRLLPLPIRIPPVTISMVWHERSKADAGHQWLRQQFRGVAKRAWMPG